VGRYSAKDLTRRDIRTLLEEIIERGAPIMANRTLAVIPKMFNFAMPRGHFTDFPRSRLR